ncbi:MAG TPA: hypothetical protein VE548_05370 [Nitrososphaeraceae archaeon]|nr:hypothetical protein [Nitrososphaeraceae archaeon]
MSRFASKQFFALIVLSAVAAVICGSSINFHYLSKLHAQIEITTDKLLELPIFNETQTEQSLIAPKILYSALNNDTIVGEVLNNFSYPIELVSITATVYDKNGIITATGDKYVNDYVLKPGSRSGFSIFLDEPLPGSSKYMLTTSFKKSDDNKPEALLLSIGKNYKQSNSFRVLGEVINHGQNAANPVKVSGIFYDNEHKVIDSDYTYTNPDIISHNKKAPFEFSFYVNNPERIKSMAFNVQSDEYSLITNTTQNQSK